MDTMHMNLKCASGFYNNLAKYSKFNWYTPVDFDTKLVNAIFANKGFLTKWKYKILFSAFL